MRLLILLASFVSLPAFAQYTGSYSERSRAIREQNWRDENSSEIARTQQINAVMVAAASTYARGKGYAIERESMKCPTRREIYWYGFNVPRDDDAWSSIRYQYCEFNVGSEACRIGMTFSPIDPVRVYCLGTDGVRRTSQVSADGRVSAVRDETSPKTRQRSR